MAQHRPGIVGCLVPHGEGVGQCVKCLDCGEWVGPCGGNRACFEYGPPPLKFREPDLRVSYFPHGGIIQDRFFEERAEEYQRLKDAQSALDFLQLGGVVNTPDLFWTASSGESLVEAIKKLHHKRMWEGYK